MLNLLLTALLFIIISDNYNSISTLSSSAPEIRERRIIYHNLFIDLLIPVLLFIFTSRVPEVTSPSIGDVGLL
jgi:hypothetical protein